MPPAAQPSTFLTPSTPVAVNRTRLAASVANVPGARDAFLAFLEGLHVPSTEQAGWALVFNEAVTNAIRHGCNNNDRLGITLEWWAEDHEIAIAITDPGSGPPRDLIESPSLPDNVLSESGRGLFIIEQFCDRHEHWIERFGYRQVLSKGYPDSQVPAPTDTPLVEEDLSAILDELSSAHECLSAFHRFGTTLIGEGSAVEVMSSALDNIALLQSPSPDLVMVCLSDVVLPTVRREMVTVFNIMDGEDVPRFARRVAEDGHSFFWESEEEVSDDDTLSVFGCGCVFPIVANGRTYGSLIVAHEENITGFRDGDLSNLRTFSDLLGIALANSNLRVVRDSEQRAKRELEIAAELQRNMLPIQPPPESPDWKVILHHRSAEEVAGDYLEAQYDAEGNLVLAMIDVMGKGVSAAMLAAIFRTSCFMNLHIPQSLEALVQSINRTLCHQLQDMTMFTTCAIARVHRDLRHVEIVNAGHCPVLLMRGTEIVREIAPSGPPLGIMADATYEAEPIPITGDEALVLVTDGLFEWQPEETSSWWGWENFTSFLRHHLATSAPESLWDALQEKIESCGAAEQKRDDETLLYWGMKSKTPS